jgi:hypothetical protein
MDKLRDRYVDGLLRRFSGQSSLQHKLHHLSYEQFRISIHGYVLLARKGNNRTACQRRIQDCNRTWEEVWAVTTKQKKRWALDSE